MRIEVRVPRPAAELKEIHGASFASVLDNYAVSRYSR